MAAAASTSHTLEDDLILIRQMKRLASRIQQAFSNDRYLPEVKEEIARSLQLSDEECQRLIYWASAKVNLAQFGPLQMMELNVAEACNLSCSYCFEKNMQARIMSAETAKQALDFLFDNSGSRKHLAVTFFGGEPLINFHVLREAAVYGRERASRENRQVLYRMTSNGVLLSRDVAHFLKEMDIRVLLSLDGRREIHDMYRRDKSGRGTFDKVMETIYLLKEEQQSVCIRMTISPETVQYLEADVKSLHDNGVTGFVIAPVDNIVWPGEALQLFAEQLTSLAKWYRQKHPDLWISAFEEKNQRPPIFGCYAGRTSVNISAEGKITGCAKLLALNSADPVFLLGDVFHGMFCVNNRRRLIQCGELKRNCKRRGLMSSYKGGCFVDNYFETGNLFDPSLQSCRFQEILDKARIHLR